VIRERRRIGECARLLIAVEVDFIGVGDAAAREQLAAAARTLLEVTAGMVSTAGEHTHNRRSVPSLAAARL